MDFEFSAEQKAVRDLIAGFAAREIAPHAPRWDREAHFPVELFEKLGKTGVMGMAIPERYGGAQMDVLSSILAIEELSKVDAGVGVTVAVHAGLVARIIARFATEDQKSRYLPAMAVGTLLGAFALTESESGSDASSLRTRARREGESYVLDGVKQWVTNGGYAGVYVVFARTGGPGPHGISAFLVDSDTPGLGRGRTTDKLGIRSSDTTDIVLEGARIPITSRLGEEGDGYRIALANLATGRLSIAAQAVGILAACLETSTRYALERYQFGRPIGAFQAVSFKIADMATDLDAARLMLYHAACASDRGNTGIDDSSRAKLFASTAARKHAAECVQILGGYGYTTEFPAERYYRDAKITEIYEGTSEVQRIVIARGLLGRLDERTGKDRPTKGPGSQVPSPVAHEPRET